jgi:hypothetical protein
LATLSYEPSREARKSRKKQDTEPRKGKKEEKQKEKAANENGNGRKNMEHMVYHMYQNIRKRWLSHFGSMKYKMQSTHLLKLQLSSVVFMT